ncbi:MAG: helix-turn-helix domain-containing protein [Pseudomonadota bacterium]|nr:helix-turn-helix domain-containing protein [Pseudomonadota bacterium]
MLGHGCEGPTSGKYEAAQKRRGWSQEELADQAGLHRTFVSGLERMTRYPTLTVLERLAKAFWDMVACGTVTCCASCSRR